MVHIRNRPPRTNEYTPDAIAEGELLEYTDETPLTLRIQVSSEIH